MFYIVVAFFALLAGTCCLGNDLNFDSRLIGGVDNTTDSFSYQVSVEYEKLFRCSGVIVHPSWVLTVAHCVNGLKVTSLRVRAKSYMRVILGELRNISRYVTHEHYDSITADSDIALLKVVEPYVLDDETGIHSIPIATNAPPLRSLVTLTGWGAPQPGVWLSSNLQRMEMSMEYIMTCRETYLSLNNIVTENMTCAWSPTSGPCQGDSGDPLVYNDGLVGLMSWSYGCAERRYPPVFTAVYKYLQWIENKIPEVSTVPPTVTTTEEVTTVII